MAVHVPVSGSHISDVYAGSVESLLGCSRLLVPPVTKTFPSGSKVALWFLRPPAIEPVYVHEGTRLFRSIISAVAVGNEAQFQTYGSHVVPPITRILPSSYITDDPQLRGPKLVLLRGVQVPVPDVSRYRVIWLGPAQNTLPFGATCMKG